MGKRKERRLAALSNAGRRVKLDLFAEPSGDLGGSSVHDEVGGDTDSKHRDGLPNSPSSSGQQPQNPLMLLGQYSDDEMDEESTQGLNHATVESSLHNDEVNGSLDEEGKDLDVDSDEDLTAQKVKQIETELESISRGVFENLDDSDKRDSDPTTSGDLQKETDFTEQTSVPVTSEVQVVGDVTLGWKIVMHEESNRYYYWNIETGETSWEVPDVLAQASGSTNGQITHTDTEKTESAPVGIDVSNITSGVMLDGSLAAHIYEGAVGANMVPHSVVVYGHGYQMDEGSEAYKNETSKDANWGTDVMHNTVAIEGHGVEIASQLVKQSECLLERLKSLKGSNENQQSHDWISKYILEVEIRLSDLKSLSSYGSSLLPFWVHSERQLKRLESAINDEFCEIAKSAQLDEVDTTHISSFKGKDKLQQSMGHESEAADGSDSKVVLSNENSQVATYVDASTIVPKDPHDKAPVINAENSSLFGSPTRDLGSGAGVCEQVNGTSSPNESTHKHEFNAAEDVDMDVDMEVEDSNSLGNTKTMDRSSTQDFVPPEHLIEPNPPAEYPSLVAEDGFIVPPPPEEDWIPPPPPDNEQIPPPPPDEPPEPSYPPPPSYPEIGQPISFTDQYSLLYPDSGFEYYGHTVTQVPSSNLYGLAEGSQVAVPHAPVYYDAVPNAYAETASVIVNPVEPVVYYQLQDGTVPPVPVVSVVESSAFHSEPAPVGYDTLSSEQIVSVNSLGAGDNLLPHVNTDSSAVGGETDKAYVDVPLTSATIQAPASISVKESVSVQSTDAVSATSVGTKVQSKALRSKKRTVAVAPSLRSNKKVSSLVDKWKAAKEELLEDEEEPEDAYETLERKRQREIEEWRARQIATGEAKDNANFQPLGGDWRERVKRRRAQLAKEARKARPEAHADSNQQPDLIELSKGLPSGWQVYWDESSKQVYYGNTVTSETTWTRPTK